MKDSRSTSWICVMEEKALPEGSMAPVYPLGINVVLARVGDVCVVAAFRRWRRTR